MLDKLQTISQTCLRLPLHFILLPLSFPLGALEIQILIKKHLHNHNFLSNLSFAFFHSMLVAGSNYIWKYKHPHTCESTRNVIISRACLRPLFYFTLLPLGFPRQAHRWTKECKKNPHTNYKQFLKLVFGLENTNTFVNLNI